jgi:NAD(P)-dependent dehydrogenase (short-subunit alcohol dehydrogenase family)
MPKVIITGGAKRLGKALLLKFAENGWDVAFTFHTSNKGASEVSKLCHNLGVRCINEKVDIRNRSDISAAFQSFFAEYGDIDVLVNNAAIFPKPTAIKDITEEDLENVLATNLKGAFYASQIFADLTKSNARIINIASMGAFEIWKHRAAYHISKAGIIQLTKAFAKELAPKISVNSVSPGMVLIPDEPAADSSAPPLDKIPMQRFATTDDIFDAVYFFATKSKFITGQNISVDGGFGL